MKISGQRQCRATNRWWIPVFTLAATLLAVPVQAATSFPNYPLQSGLGSVPPNIMFILDDSGSMDYLKMPQDKSSLSDNPSDRSYVNNSIYYNPAIIYNAWRTGTGTDRMTTGLSVRAVYSSTAVASGSTSDIRDSAAGIFYMPIVDNPGEDLANFDKYRIASSSSANSVNGAVVQRFESFSTTMVDESNLSLARNAKRYWNLTVPAGTQILYVSTNGGSGDADLRVTDGINGGGSEWCISRGSSNRESCTLRNSLPSRVSIEVQAYSAVAGLNVSVVAEGSNWNDRTPVQGRSQADELRNFATWYSYHRSRMKSAKAGASEAFAELGSRYRVGLDTIWNRGGASENVSGSEPSFPIPVNSDAGRFEGSNRSTWFSRLQGAGASNGTPLHGALARTGRYYKTATPWTDGTGTPELACRASFAILTTDGYWNSSSGYSDADAGSGVDAEGKTIASGNADGDGFTKTLADVAMNYYRQDLRPTLANQVPASAADPAKHQHMVTFGVSIGQGGTLDTTQEPPAVWPNPWSNRSWSDSDASLKQQQVRIDDLWHAAVNSKGKFVVASDSETFASALRDAFTTIDSRNASGSNLASNGPQIQAGTRMYQAKFDASNWSGQLESYAYSLITKKLSTTPEWTLVDAINTDAGFVARTVLTWNDGGKALTLANMANSSVLGRAGGLAPVTADDNLAYIKGVRTKEKAKGGKLRDRRSPLGDIVNSSPVFVNETKSLYLGANDGMLHGLRAEDGKVMFSYVPAGIDFGALSSLSDPDYQHRFFVDGQLDVTTRAHGAGKNLLIGTLGRGGKGAFALNVTNPAGINNADVLWDNTFQTGGDNDMGYVLGAPIVRKSNDGRTIALVPNGIESSSGRAVLFVYVLANNGSVASTIKLYGGPQTSNGLMAINAADLDGNGTIDSVYGGDIQGNVWKWDFSSANVSAWGNAIQGNFPLFIARDSNGAVQPITGGFALAREPISRRIFISFGTGKFMADGDIPATGSTVQTQTLYGLVDGTVAITSRSSLQQRTIPYVGVDSKGRKARSFESYKPLPVDKKGWYVDLGVPSDTARGERVVTAPTANGRALWVASMIPLPGQGCDPLGSGYLNALDMFTGTNPARSGDTFTYIDVNGNGQGDDKITTKTGSGNTTPDGENGFITSVDLGVAMPGKPKLGDKAVCISGSSAETECIEPIPPPDGAAGRIMWRELIAQ